MFLYILFFILINTTNLKAVECDLEFELGDSPSKAFESLSKNEDDLISPEDMTHSYIEQDYYVVCPDEGMQNAKIQVLIKNDQIKGIKLTSGFITLGPTTTVSSNNATTVLGSGGLQGSLFYDSSFLYVAVSNTQVKRVALSVFSP